MHSHILPAVGFIGLGDQGLPMARAIAEAGYPLHAWARRAGSLNALVQVAYTAHDAIEQLAASSDIVCLCVSTRSGRPPCARAGVGGNRRLRVGLSRHGRSGDASTTSVGGHEPGCKQVVSVMARP